MCVISFLPSRAVCYFKFLTLFDQGIVTYHNNKTIIGRRRNMATGSSKGWPGAPCESCAPCGRPNETVCKIAMLHNTCIYSVASHSQCQITPFTPEFLAPQIQIWPPQTAAAINAHEYGNKQYSDPRAQRTSQSPIRDAVAILVNDKCDSENREPQSQQGSKQEPRMQREAYK